MSVVLKGGLLNHRDLGTEERWTFGRTIPFIGRSPAFLGAARPDAAQGRLCLIPPWSRAHLARVRHAPAPDAPAPGERAGPPVDSAGRGARAAGRTGRVGR